MVLYVPGTEETDPKKQNMSLQQIGAAATTNATNTATNTADIATNATNIAANTSAIATLNAATYVNSIAGNGGAFTLSTGLANTGNALRVSLTTASNILGADVLLNNTGTFFDGPSMAQGTSGTWFVSGTVTLTDTAAAAFLCKLWDGTTVISSAVGQCVAAGRIAITLSGIITSPAANIRISVEDGSTVNGKILFNLSGLSKDSSIWGIRIA